MSKANPELTKEIGEEQAEKAMKAHAEAIGIDYAPRQSALEDMLTNLRHYATANCLSFSRALSTSELHWTEECK
jgi:hypothetical protein